jgi:hypothetical protein
MNNYTKITIGFVLVLCSIVSLAFLYNNAKESSPEVPATATATEISFSAVQARNTAQDCWIAYGGRVFSITRLIQSTQNAELGLLCGKAIDTLPAELPKERLLEFQVGILSL